MRYFSLIMICVSTCIVLAGCTISSDVKETNSKETIIQKTEHTVLICKNQQRLTKSQRHTTSRACTPIGHGLLFGHQGGIVTAKHVVEDTTRQYYILHEGIYYDVINIRNHATYDLAVLHISQNIMGSTLYNSNISHTKEVRMYEKSTGSSVPLYGNIIQYDKTKFTHNIPVREGLSGSPVYDATFNVLGIITAYDTNEGTGIALRLTRSLIDRMKGLDLSQ